MLDNNSNPSRVDGGKSVVKEGTQLAAHGDSEARIQHIEGMMREFSWVRGQSYRKLAKEWGLSEDCVKQYSAQASKRIRAAVMCPDAVNAAVGIALERCLGEAISDRDLKAVASLAKTWADISGASAPQKHQVTTEDATPTAAARLVREAFKTGKPPDDAPPSG